MKKNEMKVNYQEVEVEANIEDVLEEEVNDLDKPIFEGGPTQNQINEWKDLYVAIYMTETDEDELYIWRVLNRKEFKEVMKTENTDAMYREELTCEKCILWPEGMSFTALNSGKAGTPTILAEQIMEKSGFVVRTGPIQL